MWNDWRDRNRMREQARWKEWKKNTRENVKSCECIWWWWWRKQRPILMLSTAYFTLLSLFLLLSFFDGAFLVTFSAEWNETKWKKKKSNRRNWNNYRRSKKSVIQTKCAKRVHTISHRSERLHQKNRTKTKMKAMRKKVRVFDDKFKIEFHVLKMILGRDKTVLSSAVERIKNAVNWNARIVHA